MAEPGRPRLAYCSPLPPTRSGVADYSVELLPELARHFDVELFTADGKIDDSTAGGGLPVGSLADLDPGKFGGVLLYHIGNDVRMHEKLYRSALRHPGIVVLHEFMLHHLVRDIALRDGGLEAYLDEMRYAYGSAGRTTGKRFMEVGAGSDLWAYPLFERIVDRSRGVIVHNRSARRRLLASRPAAHVVVVPHAVSAATPRQAPDRRALRRSLGLADDGLLVGSFGFMTDSKRLDVSLAAFAALRRRRPDSIYVLVGDPSGHRELPELLAGALGEGVRLVGRVELDRFTDYMLASDVAINLRQPCGGETSGTLMRLLGLERAVIVSDDGSFSELPDDCCVKIATDGRPEQELLAALLTLADDAPLRRRLGRNARRHLLTHHRPEQAAEAYASAVAEILAAEPAPQPRAPAEDGTFAARLAADVGAALQSLGVEEDDDETLRAIAGALVELGLD